MKAGPTTRFLGHCLFLGTLVAAPWAVMVLVVAAWAGRGL